MNVGKLVKLERMNNSLKNVAKNNQYGETPHKWDFPFS